MTDIRVVQFVENATGVTFVPPYTAMGVEIDGVVTGGVVFNVFEGADCHISVASSKQSWSKGFLADMGDYLFRQLALERVTVVTEQEQVVSIACRLGGQVEGVLRNHFGAGRDGTVVGILRNEWRF